MILHNQYFSNSFSRLELDRELMIQSGMGYLMRYKLAQMGPTVQSSKQLKGWPH